MESEDIFVELAGRPHWLRQHLPAEPSHSPFRTPSCPVFWFPGRKFTSIAIVVLQGVTAAVGAKAQHCPDIRRPHREGVDYAGITLMVAWLVWRGPQPPQQLQLTACGHSSYSELVLGQA